MAELRRKSGRPRDAGVDEAILDAALQSLIELGFDAMSVEGVAALAGVGRPTIYRRWPSKEDLIVAAIRRLHAALPVPDTGSLRGDLLSVVATLTSGAAWPLIDRLLPRLLGEAAAHPMLAQVLQEDILQPRLAELAIIVERARPRGEIRADLEASVALDLVASLFLYSLLGLPRTGGDRLASLGSLLDGLIRGVGSANN